ncbi:hypothetical protein [Enterococcus alishanensis]
MKSSEKVHINLKVKKVFYLKILQIKLISMFKKDKAKQMLNELDGNKYVKVLSID